MDVPSSGINEGMKTVGARCNFLKASFELKTALQLAGQRERYSLDAALFREEQDNSGVYLLLRGRVRMSVESLPRLDRLFGAGSLLGLPSTFTGRRYSLTAVALTEVESAHVPQDVFLQMMRDRPELCREAMEMLGREVSFIHTALAERRKRVASKRVCEEVATVS